MNNPFQKILLFSLYIVIGFTIHALFQQSLFSFVLFPVFLSLVICFTVSYQIQSLIILGIVAEIFSSTPPGVMTVILFIPFLLQKLFPKVEPNLSINFFIYVVLNHVAQFMVLIASTSWVLSQRLDFSLSVLPVHPLLITLCSTSVISFMAIILWHELFPSYQ